MFFFSKCKNQSEPVMRNTVNGTNFCIVMRSLTVLDMELVFLSWKTMHSREWLKESKVSVASVLHTKPPTPETPCTTTVYACSPCWPLKHLKPSRYSQTSTKESYAGKIRYCRQWRCCVSQRPNRGTEQTSCQKHLLIHQQCF